MWSYFIGNLPLLIKLLMWQYENDLSRAAHVHWQVYRTSMPLAEVLSWNGLVCRQSYLKTLQNIVTVNTVTLFQYFKYPFILFIFFLNFYYEGLYHLNLLINRLKGVET